MKSNICIMATVTKRTITCKMGQSSKKQICHGATCVMGQKAGTYTLVHKIFLPKKFDKYQNRLLVYGPVTNAVANLGSFFFLYLSA
jgi:hypothetical protein